jgi:hypothetical protein
VAMIMMTALSDDLVLRILKRAHPYKALVRLSATCRAERARWAALVARWKDMVVFMELFSDGLHKRIAARVKTPQVHRAYSDGEYLVQAISNPPTTNNKYASVLLFDPHGVLATLFYKPRSFLINRDDDKSLVKRATCEIRYDVQDRTVRVDIGARRITFRFDAAADAVATLARVLKANRFY